jgi:undecaprenyl-diphosphatase
MYLLIALILGVVEGITEFLPISSTGHLIVFESLLNFQDVKDLFTVVIQLGAIAAVVWYYRRDLWQKTVGLFRRDKAAVTFWKWYVIATIPAGLVGFALADALDRFTVPAFVAVSLIIGGVILWLVDNRPADPRHAEPVDFDQLSTKRALLVGLGQCLAIIPGVSRSGSTIVTGLLTGLNRPTATAFSFYLGIPILLAASGYKFLKNYDMLGQLPGGGWSLLVGLLAAFVTGLFAVSWLIRYISRHNYRPIAIYRIVFGLLILVLVATKVI